MNEKYNKKVIFSTGRSRFLQRQVRRLLSRDQEGILLSGLLQIQQGSC
jgi:hypothetical protein